MVERPTHVQVIAEAGVNHNGSLDEALALIDAAKDCGCHMVKFQIFDPVALDPPGARREMLRSLALPRKDFRHLKSRADDLGITFMATPFDVDSLKFLVEELNVTYIKIGSADLQNEELVDAAFATGKLVILSTGMATLDDIAGVLSRTGAPWWTTVLHCTSAYPCPLGHINLRAIRTIQESLWPNVGFSDHAEGINTSIGAVAMGARMIEKHFTLDRNAKGPDHRASIEPWEMALLVVGTEEVEKALGNGVKKAELCEAEVIDIRDARRAHRDPR